MPKGMKQCPACSKSIHAAVRSCPKCGHKFRKKAKKGTAARKVVRRKKKTARSTASRGNVVQVIDAAKKLVDACGSVDGAKQVLDALN